MIDPLRYAVCIVRMDVAVNFPKLSDRMFVTTSAVARLLRACDCCAIVQDGMHRRTAVELLETMKKGWAQ